MYRVLLPIDESEERASAQARAVANIPGHDEVVVTMLHVFEGMDESGLPDVLDLDAAEAALEVLEEYTVEGERAFGDPAEEIVRLAEKLDADVIVLGGRKRSKLGSLLFGSVSQTVSLHANRPVMVTGSEIESEVGDKPPAYGEIT